MQSSLPLEFKSMSSSSNPLSKPQKSPASVPVEPLAPNASQSEEISTSEGSSTAPPRRTSLEDSALESVAISDSTEQTLRQKPIPPPSEPMQYRAIGLVRGRYTPLPEQFTQGTLTTSDGTAINAVLLGRVMSLLRRHLDLEAEHLWVVYPRTRDKEKDLHTQIVGVWEPETLTKSNEPLDDAEVGETAEFEDGYFSIRGEVIYHSPEKEEVVVKIQQAARKAGDRPKSFKLKLQGLLTGKVLGHFWELHVQRQGDRLVIQSATSIAPLPPKRRKKFKKDFKKPTGSRRPKPYQRQSQTGDLAKPTVRDQPVSKTSPTAPRLATPKPVKRKKNPHDR